MKIVVTRPEHDDTTHYLSHWMKEVLKIAEKKGIKIVDLRRDRARRGEVEGVLRRQNPDFVIFNGHGASDRVGGHKNDVLIQVGMNESLLKSKVIYAVSCRSAQQLGPKSIEAGAITYVGYDDDFIFFYEPEMISRPLKDKRFFEFF